jgi:hypothetical protein
VGVRRPTPVATIPRTGFQRAFGRFGDHDHDPILRVTSRDVAGYESPADECKPRRENWPRVVGIVSPPTSFALRYAAYVKTITHGQKSATWAFDDAVIRLRHWGRREGFDLPSDVESVTVGSAEGCGIRVQDAKASVSRQHATLTRDGAVWMIKDVGSKNGTRLDGERRLSFALTPGIEIELGDVKLIAESVRLIELHRFLSRIIGWSDSRLSEVDAALRGIRDTAAHRTALIVCGAGDLTATVRRVHDLALGADRPFVALQDGAIAAAAESAAGGTLCIDINKLPNDLPITPETTPSCALVICARARADAAEAVERMSRTVTVELPSLETRVDEREQLLTEYARDAARILGVPTNGFREHEVYWLRDVPVTTLEDAEEVALRLVAQRNFGPEQGAAKLGISRVALSTYLRRRGIPT